ncbi:FAD-binding protein [bacterium]|nr:FAD-binding protein [bacterium]
MCSNMVTTNPSKEYRTVDKEILKRLQTIFPRDRVSQNEVDLLTYAYDATKKQYLPQVVVWPETAEEIAALFKLATETHIPVYPRGAGTGMTGGALALRGGILFSLERMNKILELDEKNRLITAQAGVVLETLKQYAQQHGLFYPPDPSSKKTASLGGTLAECAGGLNCVKYGTTKDWVQSARVVLPTGEIVKLGTKARKNVVGYNFLQLFIGSEGTLGVFSEATLRLIPYPPHRATFIALFNAVNDSALAVQRMLESGTTPCALEFIDRVSLEAANSHVQDRTLPVVDALLLVEVDGFQQDEVGRDSHHLSEICREAGAHEITMADNKEERESLWDIRRSLSPSMYAKAPYKTNEDICVPIAEYPHLLKEAYAIAERHNVLTLCFGHAGDGNIHVNFMSHKEKDPDVEQAVDELFQAVVRLGGSISGEHGIGITKQPFLAYELGEKERSMIADLKHMFDPAHILNPDKIVL